MASETKVGLLVGLGFIVCFAVILANRSRDEQISAQLPYSLLAPSPQAASPADREVSARRFAEQGTPSRIVAPQGNRQAPSAIGVPADAGMVGQSIAGLRQAEAPASRLSSGRAVNDPQLTQVPALGTVRDQRPAQVVSRPGSASDLAGSVEQAPPRSAQHVQPISGERRPSSASVEARRLQALMDRTVSLPVPTPARKTSTSARRASGKKYTVVSGDNLHRIAREHYGDSSRALVRSIFEANRTVLTNENEVRIGDVLILPHVGGKQKPAGPSRTLIANPQSQERRNTSAKPARRRSNGRPFRWYQVEANDRYSTIAAAELGDSQRWNELFELNRDIFPDADRIRAGVKIRIPTVEVADGRGGRR